MCRNIQYFWSDCRNSTCDIVSPAFFGFQINEHYTASALSEIIGNNSTIKH